jgi:pimeloyl-ACP methyl ester carboxylesterase
LALRTFADGAVFAETFGEGRPVVLALHGWGRRGADFKESLAGLSALAVDLPGFGASPPPTSVMGADGYADIVAPLLDEFDDPPVLVGHSFGGRVSVCLAARFAAKVGPVVLTGAPLLRISTTQQPSVAYRVARKLNQWGFVSEERMEDRKRRSGSADYRAATGVMRGILVKTVNETYEQEVTQIRSSVTLLWGALDREVPLEVARKALVLMSDAGVAASLEVIDGVGHHVPMEAPAELRRLIDSLL